MFVWLSQFHFQRCSARLLSSPSLNIVWSNYYNYIHILLWSLTSLKVTLAPEMFSKPRSQLSTIVKFHYNFTSTHLIGRCNDVINQARRWLVNRLMTTRVVVNVLIVQCVNMNGRQSHINLSIFSKQWMEDRSHIDCSLTQSSHAAKKPPISASTQRDILNIRQY